MTKGGRKVRKGDRVSIHYTCKLANGTLIDSSVGKTPLEFTVGAGEVLKGLEESVKGMKVGESKTKRVAMEKAYGPYHDEWVVEVGRDQFPPNWIPEVGLHYEIPREHGESSVATITRVSEASVTLDFNHPLAGKVLIFQVQLLAIS